MQQEEDLILTHRAWERRWGGPHVSVVEHPKFGKLVVPHNGSLGAVLNAAEIWGCGVSELYDATVRWWQPEDGPVIVPEAFARRRYSVGDVAVPVEVMRT